MAALTQEAEAIHVKFATMFDALYPPGLQWYWKADFVRKLSDEAIALHVEHGALLPTMHSTMHLYPIDGKARSIRNGATPWSYRDANWAGVIVGVDPSPANKERITDWAKDYWTAVHPHSAGGAYINFMSVAAIRIVGSESARPRRARSALAGEI